MTATQFRNRPWFVFALGLVLLLAGLPLLAGGLWLIGLGGSWYYALIGAVLALSGILMARARLAGAWLFGLGFVATVVWSLAEVGTSFWPLVPRLAPMLVLAVLVVLVLPSLRGGQGKALARGLAVALVAVLVAGAGAMFMPHGVISPKVASGSAPEAPTHQAAEDTSGWSHFGRTPDGTRYVPETQITPANVGQLQVAWIKRTGDMSEPGVEAQDTPLQVGDTLYACTPRNQVLALNADTGEERWRFDPGIRETAYSRCRGVGYHQATAAEGGGTAGAAPALCANRILVTTVQAKMYALDARSGQRCPEFGRDGEVDLTERMGKDNLNFYYQTSAPTVVRNLVVVGGFVMDGRAETMPGGVIRAFDVTSGELVWAFDPGSPHTPAPPPPGQDFLHSTANMWSTPAFDDALGLIYLPMGGGSDDFWGANRSKETRDYSTTILALDIATGQERWKFQTVHNDTWDYDNATQPALVDVPDANGKVVPALIQPTKTGQLFVLDRRTGQPITTVEERPVPQGAQPGNVVSPTQPYSVGMPQIGTEPLTEASMWGATFYDQLYCRIKFRQARYEGPFTPITTQPTIIYPGYYGGMNWGGVSIDKQRGLMFVNDIRMPQVVSLVPQADVDPAATAAAHSLGLYPQKGGPYATRHATLMSPLGIPCNAPPWGTMSAIDLNTRQLAWQRPAGTIKDSVLPIGIRSPLPMPVGMPTLGGPISTASGLTFYSGTQDYYLRAYDSRSGKELWKGRLPVGTQSTPMSYRSPTTGKQYVVVTAGGARLSPDHGDYIIAYALPQAAGGKN
ncbi:membrane-bound PQQ-dependent dehydrogenase, glucose/quinate/shikimate family [Pseudomonas nabeulensis]|uniref:Membrane-bound PQQ-dependent dehydrogenase, glucose/quinate/shikimate family n=1 Tax=Pseudomonas nabeulensis TaxID=2293833 RepID=A0A4Z0B8Y4_9PSED|nr:membrane-bound PQQ-dependent dehydrogenase, glucose/quinate/shikimate family [Pseudomonas nabeulensis]TFY95170.1 membrane-bound PQQ-dependent dehydrogenase, glucose/quinate/shikimate family [Pseudomonas nabeulensis]